MATNAKGTGMTSLRICAAPRSSLNRRLIAEVRKRPGLWKRGDDRLDRLQTHQAWCEIGAILNGVSPVAARKRWKNLKDVFARKYHALQKRRATEAGEGSGVITKRWQYFKDLFFVRHALRDVITRDNEQPGSDVATDHDYAGPSVGVAEAAAASFLDAPHTLDSSSEADTTGPAMPREMANGLDGIDSDTAESAQETAVIDDYDDGDETSFLVQVPVTTELEEDSFTSLAKDNGCVPKRRRGPLLPDVQSMADVSVPIREHPSPHTSEVKRAEMSSQSFQNGSAQSPFSAIMEVRSSPIYMDHITHFLFSLETYIRKTNEELQPQLQMELLNVASSYSQNTYPQLLFPRT